jgi:hypothetical protein
VKVTVSDSPPAHEPEFVKFTGVVVDTTRLKALQVPEAPVIVVGVVQSPVLAITALQLPLAPLRVIMNT